MPVATWIHHVTPDESLPGGASPYRILFGRELHSHIDVVTQTLDDASFNQGLERNVAEQQRMTQEILVHRHEARNKRRERPNAQVARSSPGAQTAAGDFVLVKEPSATLHRDSHHPKLTHDHYTGPWKVVNVVLDHLFFNVHLNGRRVR